MEEIIQHVYSSVLFLNKLPVKEQTSLAIQILIKSDYQKYSVRYILNEVDNTKSHISQPAKTGEDVVYFESLGRSSNETLNTNWRFLPFFPLWPRTISSISLKFAIHVTINWTSQLVKETNKPTPINQTITQKQDGKISPTCLSPWVSAVWCKSSRDWLTLFSKAWAVDMAFKRVPHSSWSGFCNDKSCEKSMQEFNLIKGVLHPWTLFLKTLCIFSKNKAISDKVSCGSGQKCSKELKNHSFTSVETIVVKLQWKMCKNQYVPCFEP